MCLESSCKKGIVTILDCLYAELAHVELQTSTLGIEEHYAVEPTRSRNIQERNLICPAQNTSYWDIYMYVYQGASRVWLGQAGTLFRKRRKSIHASPFRDMHYKHNRIVRYAISTKHRLRAVWEEVRSQHYDWPMAGGEDGATPALT